MTRLDQLRALRDEIDAEIERETIAAKRRAELMAKTAVVLTRGSWNTRVFAATCAHFGVTGDDLLGESRRRQTLDARHVAMWLMHHSGRAYAEIGRELGKDHTTAMNACKRVESRPDLLAAAGEIYRALTGEGLEAT